MVPQLYTVRINPVDAAWRVRTLYLCLTLWKARGKYNRVVALMPMSFHTEKTEWLLDLDVLTKCQALRSAHSL